MNEILNQWKEWECASYAMVNCLWAMRPWIDENKIIEEMRPDFGKILTHMQAGLWLKKRGYIKDVKPYRYNPLLVSKIPVVARLFGVDWEKTRVSPYKLTMWWKWKSAHYVAIIWKGKCENSWWEAFWDKGFFYFDEGQEKEFGSIVRIIL